jgi:hypothetical protein
MDDPREVRTTILFNLLLRKEIETTHYWSGILIWATKACILQDDAGQVVKIVVRIGVIESPREPIDENTLGMAFVAQSQSWIHHCLTVVAAAAPAPEASLEQLPK